MAGGGWLLVIQFMVTFKIKLDLFFFLLMHVFALSSPKPIKGVLF